MKTSLPISVVLLACSLQVWGQDQQSLGNAARENQAKKASRVIDDDNIGSAIRNPNGVQDASAKTADSSTDGSSQGDKDEAPALAAKVDDTAKHRLEVLKDKEASWIRTIDQANQKLETTTGMAREMWVRNLASAQEGLSDTRSKMPEAEAAAKAEEAQQQDHAPAPASTDGSAQQ